jgi:3-phosphoshikimate 1-carboxyvinyltransferase
MSILHLSKPDRSLKGTLQLDGSKSISNRALIMQALASRQDMELQGLSTSKDTGTLQRLLQQAEGVFHAGDAGTTFRFMAAYLALQPDTQVLDGSERMRQRPTGGLAEALRGLGADITFLQNEGYPPLRIGTIQDKADGLPARIAIAGNTSSQFLSALLLIGPCLSGGLVLSPVGTLVSRPYLEMTMSMMRTFGVQVHWEGGNIVVAPGQYRVPTDYRIEADWSAASYWYAMAVFADQVELRLKGLQAHSIQGDAVLAAMMQKFGIHTTFEQDGILLTKTQKNPAGFQWNFLECPDLAQTLAVVCAGTGTAGLMSDLDTLALKETDRIAALKQELKKTGVSFAKLPGRMHQKSAPDSTFYLVEGKAAWTETPRFSTYNDHRMAMSFAPLAFLGDIEIEHPEVVNKSYPQFWEHLEKTGFQLSTTSTR